MENRASNEQYLAARDKIARKSESAEMHLAIR